MRVDFLGSFQQVQKLLSTKVPQPAIAQDFSQVLDSATSKESPQVVEITPQKTEKAATPKLIKESPKASFDFSKIELLSPKPAAIEIEPPPIEVVKEQPNSVKTPSGLAGRFVKLPDPFQGLSRAEKKDVVGQLVSAAGAQHGIDPHLGLSVIKAESDFNPNAVSSDGHESKGLMQLLDTTGQEMMGRLGNVEKYSPFDPEQNIDLGVGYLRRLHDLFQSPTELGGKLKTFAAANSSSLEKLAVASYNAGEGRVAAAQQRASRAGKDPAVYENIEPYLPEITRDYVKRVLTNRDALNGSNKA